MNKKTKKDEPLLTENEKLEIYFLVLSATIIGALILAAHGIVTWVRPSSFVTYARVLSVLGVAWAAFAAVLTLRHTAKNQCQLRNGGRIKWKPKEERPVSSSLSGTQIMVVWSAVFGSLAIITATTLGQSLTQWLVMADLDRETWKNLAIAVIFPTVAMCGVQVFRLVCPIMAIILLLFCLAISAALRSGLGSMFEVLVATLAILLVARVFKKLRA
jgi:hypothetical protein